MKSGGQSVKIAIIKRIIMRRQIALLKQTSAWHCAMNEEITALHDNNTFEITPLHEGRTVVWGGGEGAMGVCDQTWPKR